MERLIPCTAATLIATFLAISFLGCKAGKIQGKGSSSGDEALGKARVSLVSDLNDITLFGRDGEIIAQKSRNNSPSMEPNELIPFLIDYKDIIEAIRIGNRLDTKNKGDLNHLFALVYQLPKLVAFTAGLLDAFDDPDIWRNVSRIKNLKVISLPWEDEAISLVFSNSPEIETIRFSSMPNNQMTGISDNGLDTLARFRKLSKLFLICNFWEQGPLVDLLERADRGFSQLKLVEFKHSNDEVFSALTKNFLQFKSLTELSVYYAEWHSLTKLFTNAKDTFKTRLQSLTIEGSLQPITPSPQEVNGLLTSISSLDLKRLSLTELELDDAAYGLLARLQNLEQLRLQMPSSRNVATIKESISKLTKLKALTVTSGKLPSQPLSDADFALLRKEFPLIRISKDKE